MQMSTMYINRWRASQKQKLLKKREISGNARKSTMSGVKNSFEKFISKLELSKEQTNLTMDQEKFSKQKHEEKRKRIKMRLGEEENRAFDNCEAISSSITCIPGIPEIEEK